MAVAQCRAEMQAKVPSPAQPRFMRLLGGNDEGHKPQPRIDPANQPPYFVNGLQNASRPFLVPFVLAGCFRSVPWKRDYRACLVSSTSLHSPPNRFLLLVRLFRNNHINYSSCSLSIPVSLAFFVPLGSRATSPSTTLRCLRAQVTKLYPTLSTWNKVRTRTASSTRTRPPSPVAADPSSHKCVTAARSYYWNISQKLRLSLDTR